MTRLFRLLNAGGTHSCVGVRNQRAFSGGGLYPESILNSSIQVHPKWGLAAAIQIALLLASGHPHISTHYR